MKKIIALYTIFISVILSSIIFAQGPCSEQMVAVKIVEIGEGVYDAHLMDLHNYMIEKDWKMMIYDYLLNFLKESNPEVNFVADKGDYELEIGISGAFHIWGKLRENNKCGTNYIIKTKSENNEDLYQAIKNLIGFNFDLIKRLLYDHEKKHIAPARGPNLTTKKSKEFVSPLLEERKLNINSKVYNCKWEDVFDKKGDQIVKYPSKTSRTKAYATHGQQIIRPSADYLNLGIQSSQGVSATYELARGVNPGSEEFEITACGRDRNAVKWVKIYIRGLEIALKPKKSEIKSGESTIVDVFFNTVDPFGNKRPVAGKELLISVKGIIDGHITPSKKVLTNSEGKAILKYKAGSKDEKITITAKYQPVNYPDKVIGKSSITVIPDNLAWNGKLTYRLEHQFDCTHGNIINENERREQFVELLLSVEMIEFAGSPFARIKNVKFSGDISIKYSSRMEETRKEYYGLKTTVADNTFPVSDKSLLSMLIQKKMSEDPAAMKKRFEELSKSDPGKLMEEIKSMYDGKNEDEFPVEVVLTVNGHWPIIATRETIIKSKSKNINDSQTEEMPFLFIPMEIKLNGTVSLNSDGT